MVHHRRTRLTVVLAAAALALTAGCAPDTDDQAPSTGSIDGSEASAAPADDPEPAEPLGRWTATCADVAADADALGRDLGRIPSSAEPQDLEHRASEATTPLAECDPHYLLGLAREVTGRAGGPAPDVAALALMTRATGAADLPAGTEIVDFIPFDEEGRVTYPDERIEEYQPFLHETCVDSPVGTGEDVYQCGSIAHYLPACWRADDYGFGPPAFACMHLPDDDHVIFVASEELEVGPAPAASDPSPWQAELTDGSICRVRLGGAWPQPPEGFIWSHACEGGPTQALVMPEDRSPVLSDVAGLLFALGTTSVDDGARVEVLPVTEAVFAGQRPAPPVPATGSACPSAADLEPVVREHYAGEGVSLVAEIPLECTADWVFGVAGDEFFSNSVVLHREGDSWRVVGHDEVCTHPSDLPPSFFAPHCLAG